MNFECVIGSLSVGYVSIGSSLWNVAASLSKWICMAVPTGGHILSLCLVSITVVKLFAAAIVI